MIKNKMAVWGRNLAADLFPFRLKWRMWLSYFAPVPIAVFWPQVVEPTFVNFVIVLAFYLVFVRFFSRWMIREQFKVEARLQIELFEKAHAEITALLDFLIPEQRQPFADLADDIEMRTHVLKTMLADRDK